MKRIVAVALATLVTALSTIAPAVADDQELQIGQQVYGQLEQKGEIIPRSNSMYAILDPIAARIKSVADSQYTYPFKFILVHEKSPNAFAVPGGNVYVTDSLIRFVQNKEELAGVLCHETSHNIHHDVINNNAKDQTAGTIIGLLGAITGLNRSGIGQLGENLVYSLQTSHFSREVERNADLKGAVTCAQAGYNPWGMVWLFQNFEKASAGGSLEALSDHPTDQHRIDELRRQFKANPGLYGRFSSNIATATPIDSTATGSLSPPARAVSDANTAPRRTTYRAPYCCAPRS